MSDKLQRHPSLGPGPIEPTEKRRVFVEEYIVDFSPGNAAERAGLGRSTGYALIKDPMVRSLIDQRLIEREKKNEIKVEEVVRELARIALSDLGQAFDDDGKLLPVGQMPVTFRRTVSELNEEETLDKDGNVVGMRRKIKLWNKNEAAGSLLKLFMATEEAKARALAAVSDEEIQSQAEKILHARKAPATRAITETVECSPTTTSSEK